MTAKHSNEKTFCFQLSKSRMCFWSVCSECLSKRCWVMFLQLLTLHQKNTTGGGHPRQWTADDSIHLSSAIWNTLPRWTSLNVKVIWLNPQEDLLQIADVGIGLLRLFCASGGVWFSSNYSKNPPWKFLGGGGVSSEGGATEGEYYHYRSPPSFHNAAPPSWACFRAGMKKMQSTLSDLCTTE